MGRPPSPSLCVNSPSLSEMISMDGQMQMSLGGLIYMGDVGCSDAVCDWTVVCGNEGGIHQKERMGKWGEREVGAVWERQRNGDRLAGAEGRACVSRTWLFKKNSRRGRGVRSFPLFFLSLRHAIHAHSAYRLTRHSRSCEGQLCNLRMIFKSVGLSISPALKARRLL